MKKLFLVIICSLAVLSACQKDEAIPEENEEEEQEEEPRENDSTECKIVIPDNIVVTGISESGDSIHLLTENQDSVSFLAECISDYTINKDDWTIRIEYDNTVEIVTYTGGEITFHDDSILVNPYDNAPLTAMVQFSTPLPCKVKISIEGKTDQSAAISNKFDQYSNHHEIPVYGLYCDYNNTVKIELQDQSGHTLLTKSIEIVTEPCERMQSGQMTVAQNNFDETQKDRLFLVQNAIYDGNGDVRWYTTVEGNKFYKITNDLIAIQVYHDRGWIGDGPDIRIINYFGEVLDTFDAPNRLHHEIIEKTPGGNLLIATNAQEYHSADDDTEDMIMEIDRQTGEIVKSWDMREIFDPERDRLWTEYPNDWFHLNAIQYDPSDHTLLISSKLQYFVSKIDYNTGDIEWILGDHREWEEPWQEYLLTPVNFDTTQHSDHDWPYAQHMPRLTDDGTIMVYDNGASRPGDDYTRAIEYKVDPEAMTVEKVWHYDLDNVATSVGSIQVYEDNSVQIGHGGQRTLYEVSYSGDILFEASMQIFYRSYAIQLY